MMFSADCSKIKFTLIKAYGATSALLANRAAQLIELLINCRLAQSILDSGRVMLNENKSYAE